MSEIIVVDDGSSCGNLLQDFICKYYPDQPDLLDQVPERGHRLGGANGNPGGTVGFHLLGWLLGWRMARRPGRWAGRTGLTRAIRDVRRDMGRLGCGRHRCTRVRSLGVRLPLKGSLVPRAAAYWAPTLALRLGEHGVPRLRPPLRRSARQG